MLHVTAVAQLRNHLKQVVRICVFNTDLVK